MSKQSGRHARLLRLSLVASTALILVGPANASTPIDTYFGPGLPLDTYFPEGIPGTATEPGVTVRSRERPEYDTPGIQVGAFTIRPEINETNGYNDNVIGGAQGRGSWITESSATVNVATNYSRNNFGFSVGVDDRRDWDLPDQNRTDYSVSVGGALDIGRDQLSLNYSHLVLHEDPYDVGGQGLTRPLQYNYDDVRLSYTTQFGRFTVVPNFDYTSLTFENGLSAGLTQSQNTRDRNIFQGGVITRYELAPLRNIVLVLNGASSQFTNASAAGNNSASGSALIGLDYQVNGALRFRALVGYQYRTFSGAAKSLQEPIAEADVIWTPTGLTTVTGRLSRTIEDPVDESTSGYTYTRASIVLDHELKRNILLQGNLGYQLAEFPGGGTGVTTINTGFGSSGQVIVGSGSFTQTIYNAGLGATWLINRHMQLAASYQAADQNFKPGSAFLSNIYLLQLRLGL